MQENKILDKCLNIFKSLGLEPTYKPRELYYSIMSQWGQTTIINNSYSIIYINEELKDREDILTIIVLHELIHTIKGCDSNDHSNGSMFFLVAKLITLSTQYNVLATI